MIENYRNICFMLYVLNECWMNVFIKCILLFVGWVFECIVKMVDDVDFNFDDEIEYLGMI